MTAPTHITIGLPNGCVLTLKWSEARAVHDAFVLAVTKLQAEEVQRALDIQLRKERG